MSQRPPFSTIFIYALGQLGWSLASFAPGNLLTYFYLPPDDGKIVFPSFIFQEEVLWVFSIIGLIAFGGRIIDAFTDPMIANFSDRLEARIGKRKKMMLYGIIPFAVFSFLSFLPLSTETSSLNVIWLIVTMLFYYLGFTAYLIPYNALISELGHHPSDRMKISTYISLAWILGFALGFSVYSLQGVVEGMGYDAVTAFQYVLGGQMLFAFFCMLAPILFLNEKKYALQAKPQVGNPFRAMRAVLSHTNFRIFVLSDMVYWLAMTFIQMGMIYYVTLLFGFDKGYATIFLGLGILVSLLLYVPVNLLVKRLGKKLMILVGFGLYLLLFSILSLVGVLPLGGEYVFYALAILMAFPVAIFGIIPNAIIADVVYDYENTTGQQQSGMFFAVRGFTMKLGISLANLIFPSLLLFGRSVDNSFGVRLTAVVALFFLLLGMGLFIRFKDKKTEDA